MIKNIKKLIMLFFAAATMLIFMSCNKDNTNVNPSTNSTSDGGTSGGGTTTETHGRMYGTSWTKTYKDFTVAEEGYYEDHLYIHYCTATLLFTTDNNGERRLSKDVYDEIQHETVEHYSDTVAHFTYVYNNGEKLYGPGMIYWDNGDSNKFYIQNIEGAVRLYMEGEDFPDHRWPTYSFNN